MRKTTKTRVFIYLKSHGRANALNNKPKFILVARFNILPCEKFRNNPKYVQ